MHASVTRVLAERRVIATKEHPRLGSTLRRLHREGLLANPLPGLFTAEGDRDPHTWLIAVSLWSAPAGVLHGSTAAGLWLPVAAGPVARVAHPTLRSRRGVVVTRRVIPDEFVRRPPGIQAASPAYSAAELAAVDDGRAACEALRLRLASQPELAAATTALAGCPGQRERALVIAACRDDPWSYAELRLHRILRSAGILGWVANRPVQLRGKTFVPDVRFRGRPVIIEVDGRATHQQPGQFRLDRERQNEFAMAGYSVIRFTWEHLDDPGYVVQVVRGVLRR